MLIYNFNGLIIAKLFKQHNIVAPIKAALKRHDEELQLKAREEQEQNHPRSISQIRRANTATGNLADESLHSLKEDDTNTDASKDLQLLLSSHPTSLGSLCPLGDDHSSISLICGWSAYVGESQGDKIIEGQHHLSQLNVRPKEKKKGCPLTITSKHKSNITHDFSCGLLVSFIKYNVIFNQCQVMSS